MVKEFFVCPLHVWEEHRLYLLLLPTSSRQKTYIDVTLTKVSIFLNDNGSAIGKHDNFQFLLIDVNYIKN